MRETKLKRSELMDPVGKSFAPIHPGRDGCRAPMQWNNQVNGGFTSGKPWNKIHPDYTERNVNAMIHDPDSLFTFYKNLIALRKHYRSIQIGKLELLDKKNETVLTFTRTSGKEVALIAINFTQFPQQTDCKAVDDLVRWKAEFSNKKDVPARPKNGKLQLQGEQVLVIVGNLK
jgi:glycosidase